MEKTIMEFRRRQSRQMRFEEALKFGVNEASRRHSEAQNPGGNFYLPPILAKRNGFIQTSKTRAKSIAVMKMPYYDSTMEHFSAEKTTKLPNIQQRDRKPSIKNGNHWNFPLRRVSRHNNRIIVEHLRHKLLRQHERRISRAYEEEIKAGSPSQGSIVSTDSFDEEAVQFLKTYRPRMLSISTLNMSSRATSVVAAESIILGSSRGSSPHFPPVQTTKYDEKAQEEVIKENVKSPFQSRPSICVSSETGFTDWIAVDDANNDVRPDHDVPRHDENVTSLFQRSMTDSERSVAMLIRKVRRSSVLSETSKLPLVTEPVNHDDVINPPVNHDDVINPPVNQTHINLPSDSIHREQPIVEDKVIKGNLASHQETVGRDEETLFADWKTATNSALTSRRGSFLSDGGNQPDDVTIAPLSRQNTFMTDSGGTSPLPMSNEEETKDAPTPALALSPAPTPAHEEREEEDLDPKLREQQMLEIYLGNVLFPCPKLRRKVFIYLSSSGVDTNVERRTLSRTLLLKLRQFCRERQLTFDLIDPQACTDILSVSPLYDIIKESESSMMEQRMELLKACYRDSVGPAFMCFVGNTMESPPALPTFLSEVDYDIIIKQIEEEVNEAEIQLLQVDISSMTSQEGTTSENDGSSAGKVKKSSYTSSVKSGSTVTFDIERELAVSDAREKLRQINEQMKLFKEWYMLDTNTLPSFYKLKPLSIEYKSLSSGISLTTLRDVEKRRREKQQWRQVYGRLLDVINKGGSEAVVEEQLRGAVETELRYVLSLPVLRSSDSTFWFQRKIIDYHDNLDSSMIQHFIPVKPMTNQIDDNSATKVGKINEEFKEKIGHTNIRSYPLPWQHVKHAYGSHDKTEEREWSLYSERLRLDFYNVCTMQIRNAVEKLQIQSRKFHEEEVHEHVSVLQRLSRDFIGKDDVLKNIKRYIRSRKNRLPYIVYGNSGSGKTSVLSKAASLSSVWLSDRQDILDSSSNAVKVVFRSVGATGNSLHPHLFLVSLCAQLRTIFAEKESKELNEDLNLDSSFEFAKIFNLDFLSITKKFQNLIRRCGSKKCPLLIFLDGLDQLLNEEGALNMQWLPEKLPKYTKLIVSVSGTKPTGNSGKKAISRTPSRVALNEVKEVRKNTVFEALWTLYTRTDNKGQENPNFLFLSPISSVKDSLHVGNRSATELSCENLLNHVLKSKSRTLTSEQMKLVLGVCKSCPLPLGVSLCAEISAKWHSFTPLSVSQEQLSDCGGNIESFVHSYFRILEVTHGRPLVAATASFLSSSLHGLGNSELQDLLSFDKNVAKQMTDLVSADLSPGGAKAKVQPQTKTKISKISGKKKKVAPKIPPAKEIAKTEVPDILWFRLKQDLRFLLQESLSDKILTLKWKHAVYGKVAKCRYIPMEENAKYYHHLMACYFSDENPTEFSEVTQARNENHCDIGQPLSWQPKRPQNADKENTCAPLTPVFNIRRLSEAPHHFAQCRNLDDIKTQLLFNYEWLLTKIRATSYEALMMEIGRVLRDHPNDPDVRLLSSVFHLSRPVLTSDPCQLASQLIGRLHSVIKKDKPIARLDPRKYPFSRKLLFQCRRSSIPVLVPSGSCLATPSDVLYDLHAGHSDVITAIVLTTDGHKLLTASKDGTLKAWDLFTGRVVNTLHDVGSNVTSLCVCMNNNYVVAMDSYKKIKVWCLRTSSCILCMQDTGEGVVTSSAGDMQALFVLISNSNKLMKVWDLDKIRFLHKIDISPNFELQTDQSVLCARNSRANNVLFSFQSTNEAYVYNVKRAKHLNTIKLQTDHENASITQVEVSREYYVIACMRQYMTLHEIVTFELYDAINYGHVRTIKACPEDGVFGIFLNRLGSHIIALCKGHTGTEVCVWNVETGNHQHVAFENAHSTCGACVDLQYCLTSHPSETTIRVHNLTTRIDDRPARQSTHNKSQGIGEFYPITHNSRYVVARGSDNGPITVWNITRGQCRGEAVSIERGLQEKNDVMVVKDTRVVILSDRGMSSMEHGSEQIFKTIYIYDLQTKKYVRKIHPVAVMTCPRDEYRILGADRLLGVAQDRSHFVVWSLENGQVINRMKLDFSKYELAENLAEQKKKERKWKRKKGKSHDHAPKTEQISGGLPCHLNSEARNRKIDQILLSADESTLLCSFYGYHVAVFDMDTNEHVHTLTNKHSLLLLHQAVITHRGCHLVHTNYDEATKTSYLTVWNLRQGTVLRRLKNEPLLCGLAVSENASRVVFATEDNFLKIWEPFRKGGHRKIPGYEGLTFRKPSSHQQSTSVYLMRSATRAVVFSNDISLWDLERNYVMSRFTPDVPFQCCSVAMQGSLIVAGMSDSPNVVTLRLMSHDLTVNQYGRSAVGDIGKSGIFGEREEKDSESSEEDL
nr:uncharacterized protein LOC100177451 [Ciona intestinalis]|eukprot:XP_018670119.1 uncharacterized protein LOC100177451 [Ciona intestinalis]